MIVNREGRQQVADVLFCSHPGCDHSIVLHGDSHDDIYDQALTAGWLHYRLDAALSRPVDEKWLAFLDLESVFWCCACHAIDAAICHRHQQILNGVACEQ